MVLGGNVLTYLQDYKDLTRNVIEFAVTEIYVYLFDNGLFICKSKMPTIDKYLIPTLWENFKFLIVMIVQSMLQ